MSVCIVYVSMYSCTYVIRKCEIYHDPQSKVVSSTDIQTVVQMIVSEVFGVEK
jgi:hypothetical protein